jgi:hypothetical protein
MEAAIFYKTDEFIDCDKTNIKEQIEDIIDDPNNMEIVEFSDTNEMFSIIHSKLGSTNGVTACNIWENIDTIYAGYFVDIAETLDYSKIKDLPEDKNDDVEKVEQIEKTLKESCKNTKLNTFGSQITAQSVTGNLIVIKKKLSYTITDNNVKTSMIPGSFSRHELVDMLESIFIKEGVVINSDGQMSLFKYIMNPMEHLILTDNEYEKNYIYHEYEVYTHIMIIIADVREVNAPSNKTASFLAGKPVNGTVYVALYKKPDYNENPPYVRLDIDRLNKILNLRRKSPTITTGMSASDKEYINFEKILNLEIEKHSDKPSMTFEEISGESLNVK